MSLLCCCSALHAVQICSQIKHLSCAAALLSRCTALSHDKQSLGADLFSTQTIDPFLCAAVLSTLHGIVTPEAMQLEEACCGELSMVCVCDSVAYYLAFLSLPLPLPLVHSTASARFLHTNTHARSLRQAPISLSISGPVLHYLCQPGGQTHLLREEPATATAGRGQSSCCSISDYERGGCC